MLGVYTPNSYPKLAITRLHATWKLHKRRCACARPVKRAYNAVKSAGLERSAPDTEAQHPTLDTASRGQEPHARGCSHAHDACEKALDCSPITSYAGLLSSAGKARNPGGLNTVVESYSRQPAHDRIPLHGGLPHPDAFPFAQLSVKLRTGPTLVIDNEDLVSPKRRHLICIRSP